MNKKLILLAVTLLSLSACSQSEQNKHLETHQDLESKSTLNHSHQSTLVKKASDQPTAIFAYQETPDQKLSKHCIWTDDPHAEGKKYWSILLSPELNGKSSFSADDLYLEAVQIGQAIQNCNQAYKTDKSNYAYAINDDQEWSNSLAVKPDRIIQQADQRYIIDLNKNSKAEQVYICLNMESEDVFFKENDPKPNIVEHLNIGLNYGLESDLDPKIACGKVFYKKSGIVKKTDLKTKDAIYIAK